MEMQNQRMTECRYPKAMPFLKPITTSGKINGPAVHPAQATPSAQGAAADEDPEMAAVKFQKEDLGTSEPVSPTSMMFHHPKIHGTILAVMGSSKSIDVDYAKAALEATVVRHPRFSSIQEWDGGKAKWVRTKVDVNNHVIVPQLSPEAIPSPDLFIEEYMSSLSDTMLDFSKPLWELHILNIPTSEAEATAVFRIHHSVGDGISLVSLLIACCSRSNTDCDGTLSILPCKGMPSTAVKATAGTKTWWRALVTWYLRGLAMFWNTMVAALTLLFTWIGLMKDTETPIRAGKGATELTRKRYLSMSFSLEDLRIIKRAADATINDVILGFVSAGISRYLSRRYADLGCKMPANIRLRAAVMVNLRKSLRIQAFPDMTAGSKARSQWGNRIGFLLIPLPILQYDCALDYVKSAKVVADRKKTSMESWLTYIVGIVLTKVFGTETASAMLCQVMSNITVLLSNIPGPSKEIEFLGHHMSHSGFTIYGAPQAICIHCLSYMDKMKIFLGTDENMIPDPHQLCKDISESFNSIKDVILREE